MTETPDRGSVALGCLIGGTIQGLVQFGVVFWMVSTYEPTGQSSSEMKRDLTIYYCVEFTQWIILLPLIRRATARGQVATRRGLIISAAVAVLIGTACGGNAVRALFR